MNTRQALALDPDAYYRVTALAGQPSLVQAVVDSVYLRDVLELCQRGASTRELRQCMPPSSLRASLARLIEMDLIERVDDRYLPSSPTTPITIK